MRIGRKFVLGWCLVLMGEPLVGNCWAQDASSATAASVSTAANTDSSSTTMRLTQDTSSQNPPAEGTDNDNAVGIQFIKNLATDQKAIWTSPFHLQWGDASWLVPLGEATAAFIATDPSTARALSNNPSTLNHYRTFSNYGLGSYVAAGAGFYVWGRITHDDHKRETGVLTAEAMIDSFGVNTALQYAFGRERPYQDSGEGLFWHGGTSFPSDHAMLAWSAASVIAHEYPGTMTDLLVYGMATAVTVSRVLGKEHYPSDALVGSAIGWLIGHEVYRLHHNPELGGSGWEDLSGSDQGEKQRDPKNMGSPFVPLDSWVYPVLDRLAALGYVNTLFEGMRPWTRLECARLTEEVAERMADHPDGGTGAEALEARLEQEFAYEFGLLEGEENLTANVESVYARAVSISGPPLTDGYHFGQTIAYDFGRPFERGTNAQAGGAFTASAGPVTVYVRAEYQHAPAAPAPSPAVINVIALRDAVPPPPDVPVPEINQVTLLDAYLAVNLSNWEISLGRQSLDWGPGPGGSLIWNDNIQPMNMARIVNPEPFQLPSFLHFLGPMKFDQFFGRLEGHTYIRRPFLLGQKISFKPLPSLELGFARTFEIGGDGPGATPLNTTQFVHGFFGRVFPGTNSVPGHSQSEFDWTFYVPKVRNYIVFYGDMYAADDPIPWFNPPKNPFRPGIYITRFPKLPKLDFHMEAADTESPGFDNPVLTPLEGSPTNHGDLNYWNGQYRDGSTYNQFLIGNTVGRDGRAIQAWTNYWISPRDTLQFSYKHSIVRAAFIPGGGAWQDYNIENDLYTTSGFYVRAIFQYEHISSYPLLFPNGPQQNFSVSLELGFLSKPHGLTRRGPSQP
jgi:membrane-associated phospholipid phosphatase